MSSSTTRVRRKKRRHRSFFSGEDCNPVSEPGREDILRRKNRTDTTIIAVLAVLLCIFYFSSWKQTVMRKFVYPLEYDDMVRQYAHANGVRPSLVAAVVLAESKFNQEAASRRGASGLMQIMPETGEWIAEEMGLPGFSADKLSDVSMNLRMGTWYLAYLFREYDGNTILVLSAYNAGRGQVDEWIKEYGWDKNFSEIEQIPFSETREYVKVVMQNEEQYKALYDF